MSCSFFDLVKENKNNQSFHLLQVWGQDVSEQETIALGKLSEEATCSNLTQDETFIFSAFCNQLCAPIEQSQRSPQNHQFLFFVFLHSMCLCNINI